MINPLDQIAELHSLLTRGLRSTKDLLEAAQLCRSLISPEIDGSGAFLLFALYLESIDRLREGQAIDADEYENGMALLIQTMKECLDAIENYDVIALHANLDSFARTSKRLRLP